MFKSSSPRRRWLTRRVEADRMVCVWQYNAGTDPGDQQRAATRRPYAPVTAGKRTARTACPPLTRRVSASRMKDFGAAVEGGQGPRRR